MKNIVGRASVFAQVCSLLNAGATVLVYGPVGVGKTTLLDAIARRASALRVPCGRSPRTETVSDVTSALAQAFPDVDASNGSRRRVRARLRMTAETRRCWLLLDQLGDTGTLFKGTLKAMRGTGVGVLLAADVEHRRDHERVRKLKLAAHEIALAPLTAAQMRVVLITALASARLPNALDDDDIRELLRAAEGIPGRAMWFAKALASPHAWTKSGHPRAGWLRTEAIVAAAERYRKPIE